jgi:DegV family protein with EDD domain
MARVAVVTDSTALLPPGVDVTVVPVQVVIGEESFPDGAGGASSAALIAALAAKKPVTTSRPSPSAFTEAYEKLAAEGYDEIVSIHVSSAISGTKESAQLAADQASIPVVVIDSRAAGPCLGLAVQAAAAAASARKATAASAGKAALDRASHSNTFFYVDSLEPMRRGGRIGTRSALVGSALSVKPLLGLKDGQVVLLEKVRTSTRAIARLKELAIEAADGERVQLMVAHVGAAARAEAIAEELAEALSLSAPIHVTEVGAGLSAHLGSGALGVVVAPAL